MWKSFCQNTNEPAIYLKVDVFSKIKLRPKTREEQLIYRISVTNYVKLWTGVFDYDNIVNIMLESNKDIETEDKQGLLHAGLRVLHNPQLVDQKEFTELDMGYMSVKLECWGPIVLKMIFSLNVATADNFFYSIIRPLLIIADNQMHSENKLRRRLVLKERKITKLLTKLGKEYPLTWYLRTDMYDDREHMNRYNAMTTYWGTNAELGVCPRHILCGKPLPKRPYDSEPQQIINFYPGPSGITTKQLYYKPPKPLLNPSDFPYISKRWTLPVYPKKSVQSSAVKIKPIDDTIEPEVPAVKNDQSDGTSRPNDDASLPEVAKSGPNDDTDEPKGGISGPNDDKCEPIGDTSRPDVSAVKSDPNDGTSAPNNDATGRNDDVIGSNDDVIGSNADASETNDGITVSGSNEDTDLQTAKETVQSPEQNAALTPDSPNQPMPTDVIEQAGNLGPTPKDQDFDAQKTVIPEAEPDSLEIESSMPKKRRTE